MLLDTLADIQEYTVDASHAGVTLAVAHRVWRASKPGETLERSVEKLQARACDEMKRRRIPCPSRVDSSAACTSEGV